MTDPGAEVEREPRSARNCYKCGRPVGPDDTICSVCNQAGMATPSATQYHGTIVVAIVTGVVLLAVWASLAMSGIGPYEAMVLSVAADAPDGVIVSVQVSNNGTRPGRAKCALEAQNAAGIAIRIRSAVSPQVPAGGSVTFDDRIAGLTEQPARVTVVCS
ncbi:MAG: hypothetical protein OEW24_00735 [Chloroflexota bacterium]|nr:hypothetical protein [Chloroflexota bacterium]